MQNFLKMIRDSKGATAIEYGLIAALIAVAAIAAMGALGDSLKDTFATVGNKLDTAASAEPELGTPK